MTGVFLSFPRYDWFACDIHLPVCSWIMDPHSRAPKKNTSQGNEVLPQRTIRLIQGPCYQQGSPRQDPAGNRTTRRPPDHRKEKQTAVVWTCLPFTVPCKMVLARSDEWKTYPYHCSLRLFTMVRRSSCDSFARWILARTSSLVTWSLYQMCSSLR